MIIIALPVLPIALQLPDDSSDGRAIYLRNCSMCHGVTGRGDRTLPDLSDPRWRAAADPARIRTIIRNGTGPMPSFGEVLSAQQIEAVARHLFTLADGDRTAALGRSTTVPLTVGQNEVAYVYLKLGTTTESTSRRIRPSLFLQARQAAGAYEIFLSRDAAGLQSLGRSRVRLAAEKFNEASALQKAAFRQIRAGAFTLEVRVLEFALGSAEKPSFATLTLLARVGP